MSRTRTELHLAAQYLAASAISFIQPKDDDSHTNLGWNPEIPGLFSRELDESGIFIALDFAEFSLKINKKDNELWKMPLSGRYHSEIIKHLKEVFKDLNFGNPFKYKIHYDLDYSEMDSIQFGIHSSEDLKKESDLRTKAFTQLSQVNTQNKSETRVWPHHFDMAFLIQVSKENSIGVGMAMPDSIVEDYYYYVSGYKGHDSIDPADFKPLKDGAWISNGWKGGVLKISDQNPSLFLEEAIKKLSSLL